MSTFLGSLLFVVLGVAPALLDPRVSVPLRRFVRRVRSRVAWASGRRVCPVCLARGSRRSFVGRLCVPCWCRRRVSVVPCWLPPF